MKGATNPQNFDRIVRDIFAPIYPVIAEQIKERTGITSGKCLDAGCGTGALGRAIAKITDLNITFFDQSNEMLELAKGYTNDENIGTRSTFLQGDIHSIDLPSESIDIVISRGSSPFWDDWRKAYSEILRILKPGGMTYIGGGFGNVSLREEIVKTMNKNNPNWQNSFKARIKPERDALPGILAYLNPTSYEIINDDSGFWAVITK
ncbi:MAG: class I SAM-dependent methyltransferase [Campylobacterales bacterium]|nr:class I SAM-dependent methyltransferase [Campylobacterales bacterium]